MQDLTYRKELDGIRSIAVVSVILFHVGFPSMPGGFVGVDVFFVLSGYLICGQTYLRLREGSYSATEFFARRIRSIVDSIFCLFSGHSGCRQPVVFAAGHAIFVPEPAGVGNFHKQL